MKKIKLEKLSPICWITFMALLTAAAVFTGCGHRSQFNAQVGDQPTAEASPGVQDQVTPVTNPVELTSVSETASNLRITDAAVLAYDLITDSLVIRSETFTNSNSAPVWVWIHPSVSGLHLWGLCSFGRAQYQSVPSSPLLHLGGAKEVSKDLPMDGWGAFEVAAGATATLEWVSGGSWGWIQGPYPAPSESCNEGAFQRGWAGFQIDGIVGEDVRITLPKTPYAEATGDRNFLDSTRVLALPAVRQFLSQHWGDPG
jgi:hypothetical protein